VDCARAAHVIRRAAEMPRTRLATAAVLLWGMQVFRFDPAGRRRNYCAWLTPLGTSPPVQASSTRGLAGWPKMAHSSTLP
jgi:hypothetical protein